MNPRLFQLPILAAALFGASVSIATEPPPAEINAWIGSDAYATVEGLWRDYGVVVADGPDSGWRPGELDAFARGLDALPWDVREAVVPLRIERRRRTCFLGQGRYDEDCPTWTEDGAFLVYDPPPVSGDIPEIRRLAPLTRAERVELMRRRAAVHAVLHRFDVAAGWSQTERWRRINGWRKGRALNRDVWGYARYLGRRTPRLDLVTFAEAYFVRPADVVDDRSVLDRDVSLACQEFTRIRYLEERLVRFDPTWHPPARVEAPPDERCPAFEQWARFEDLEGIDILVASATADRPESLYGHLLLHVRYESGSEGFEPVYQFGAVTDTDVHPVEYFGHGLSGGFLAVLEVNSFRAVDRMVLQLEQRNLRRYRLNLGPRQERQLLERIWEAERHVRYPYHFFPDNCASFLVDLIAPALDIDVPERSHFIVAPTDVLDLLANVENGERGPLLRKLPEDLFSNRERALAAVEDRRETLDELVEVLGEPAGETLRAIDRQLDGADPEVRAQAYRELEETLADVLPDAGRRARELAIAYLYACSVVERYFVELAAFRSRAIRAGAVLDPVVLTAEEILERRRELYRHEDLERRYEKILEYSAEPRRRVEEGRHRPYTDEERAKFALEEKTRTAYRAALDAQAHTIETFHPDFDAVGFLDAREEAFRREQASRDRRAIGPSGKGRIAVAGTGGVLDGAPAGTVDVSAAVIAERLGEQRRRGFRSDIESETLSLRLRTPVTGAVPVENLDAEFVLFRFLTIEQKLGPVRENLFDTLGWGADLRAGHDGRRGLWGNVDLSAGYLLPVWTSDNVANHLVIGAFPKVSANFGRDRDIFAAGVDMFASLRLHLYGPYVNVLRLDVGSGQYVDLARLGHVYDVRSRLATEHAVFWAGQYPAVLGPFVELEATTFTFDGSDRLTGVGGGVRLELPW